MVSVNVAFGKCGLDLELPSGPRYEILHARTAPPLGEVSQALTAALDDPIGSPALGELAAGKRSAAIAVCDITRPAPNAITLPPLLKRLETGGIARDRIAIFIATGLHRPATEGEMRIIVGEEIAGKYQIHNHFAKNLANHAAVGTTRSGTPVYIEKGFVDADLHITLGFIEQHLMAGFSGGRKLIAPGLAAQETIKVLHSPKFMRQPTAVEGSISRNPLHTELLEIAAMVRHDFMLDVTLTKAREIAGVFAGNGVHAHAAGVEFVRQTLLETLEEPVDAAITTGAGYPLDLTFYQTIKGISSAQHIVKPGGKILAMGECAEGLGTPEFAAKLAELTTFERYLKEILNSPVVVDQWQLEKLALAGQNHELLFYTPGVSREVSGGLAHRIYDRPDAALAELVKGLPKGARVAVIPEGSYVFAQIKDAALV